MREYLTYNPANDEFFKTFYPENALIAIMRQTRFFNKENIFCKKNFENNIFTAGKLAATELKKMTRKMTYRDYINGCGFNTPTDMYFAPNPLYFNSRRCKTNIACAYWCYVDLDVFHDRNRDEITEEEIDHTYANIVRLFNNKVPYPTVTVFTGRGFQLYWRLKQNILGTKMFEHRFAKKRWVRLNRQLAKRCIDYKPDMKVAGDISRLLRVPGTFNFSAGKRANIVEIHEDYTYTLDQIDTYLNGKCPTEDQLIFVDNIMEYLGDDGSRIASRKDARRYIKKHMRAYMHKKYGKSSEKAREYCRDLGAQLGISVPKSTKWYYEANLFIRKCRKKLGLPIGPNSFHGKFFTLANLAKRRLNIIHAAVEEDNDRTGYREMILFVARYYTLCLNNGDDKDAVEKILNLNRKFLKPLSESEVIHATSSAVKYYESPLEFKMKNETFYELIGLSDDEIEIYQKKKFSSSKKTGKKEKKELTPEEQAAYNEKLKARRSICNRRYREKKRAEAGLLPFTEMVSQRQAAVKKYLTEGYSTREIAELVGCNMRTINRDIKKIFGTGKSNEVRAILQAEMEAKNSVKKAVTEKIVTENNSVEDTSVTENNVTKKVTTEKTINERVFGDEHTFVKVPVNQNECSINDKDKRKDIHNVLYGLCPLLPVNNNKLITARSSEREAVSKENITDDSIIDHQPLHAP